MRDTHAVDDGTVEEILAAVRNALTRADGLDAFHQLAQRYERSVHQALAQGENPELSPEQVKD